MKLGMACREAFDTLAKKKRQGACESKALTTENTTLSQQYKDTTDTIERLRH